jgi:hypothetical protein
LEIKIRFQPKQSKGWSLWDESPIERLGIGGARGGAKSGFVRRGSILRRLKYPATNGLILRRTFPDLYKSHIIKMYAEFPEIMKWYNHENKEIRFPNGSRQFFGYAEHAGDLSAFESSEFDDIVIDEGQQFSQGEIERLYVVNRSTANADITPKTVISFMPGLDEDGIPPIGLPYLKRVFADGKPEGPELEKQWAFVQAFSWDNIEWCRKELSRDGITEEQFYSWTDADRREYFLTRTVYGSTLAAMTDKDLRDAWLFGKFDVFQGQYFPHFSKERHVRPSAEVLQMLKPWYSYWLSGDWGYDHPHAIYLNAKDENNRVITFGEIWGRKVSEPDLAQAINEKCSQHKVSFKRFTFSWDAGKLSPRANPKFPKSIGQLISDGLRTEIPKPHPADSSAGSRVARARLTSMLLEDGNVVISDECKHLVECLPSLVRDPDNTEDVMKIDFAVNKVGDDAYDGWSMGLQEMLGKSIKPHAVERAELLGSYDERIIRIRQLRNQLRPA